jgi:hypothetical protein
MFRPESSLHPCAITTSYIYTSYSPSISSMVRALRDRENIQTVRKFPSPPPHLSLKHLCFIVFGPNLVRILRHYKTLWFTLVINYIKTLRNPRFQRLRYQEPLDISTNLASTDFYAYRAI